MIQRNNNGLTQKSSIFAALWRKLFGFGRNWLMVFKYLKLAGLTQFLIFVLKTFTGSLQSQYWWHTGTWAFPICAWIHSNGTHLTLVCWEQNERKNKVNPNLQLWLCADFTGLETSCWFRDVNSCKSRGLDLMIWRFLHVSNGDPALLAASLLCTYEMGSFSCYFQCQIVQCRTIICYFADNLLWWYQMCTVRTIAM